MTDVLVEFDLAGLRSDHPAAQVAHRELLADLRTDPRLEAREQSGQIAAGKGLPVELIVSLGGTSGALAAVARILKLWLQRDRRRSVKVSVRTPAGETIVSVEGDQISTETLAKALESAANWRDLAGDIQEPGGGTASSES
jgi:hypothetical protein